MRSPKTAATRPCSDTNATYNATEIFTGAVMAAGRRVWRMSPPPPFRKSGIEIDPSLVEGTTRMNVAESRVSCSSCGGTTKIDVWAPALRLRWDVKDSRHLIWRTKDQDGR